MQRNKKHNVWQRTLIATAVTGALLAAPFSANAAGMGKITVLSALGQPLRAELDVSASKDELSSLAARVAPTEAFRQANLEYADVLSTVRFVLDKRPDGRPYFKIQTDRAVNDPFIDFLVELSWSSGRLVREYAFLLDPPDLKSDTVPAVVNAPSQDLPSSTLSADDAPKIPSVVKKEGVSSVGKQASKAKVATELPASSEDSGNTRAVKVGDTLGKIAAETVPEGVTLDQMLVALFNNNREAFVGNNMNRLRAGKILAIPEAEKIASVPSGEARKIVIAQSADFNAYRNSLASSMAEQKPVEQRAEQRSSGKIAPKIEDKTALADGRDKLQVSKSETGAKAGKGKLSEEDLVARDKALKEANSRISELEKNLTDLKKLAELKSQAAADAQKAASTTVQVNAADTAPVAVAVNAAPPAISAVADIKSSAPAISAGAATPAGEMPKPKAKKKKFIPSPPPPEPSFLEQNLLLVYGAGGLLSAVLGFLGFRVWKRKRNEAKSFTASDIAANSVFGSVATSESIDTSASSQTDFGHSTIDEIDTSKEGVDPIQEAEVYMAYGRDGQAEDILLDALQKDPDNQAVQLKLLEIYAGRKSVPQFNAVATDLNRVSGGAGLEWEKAAALGQVVDPSNPLYGAASVPQAEHEQTVVMGASESEPSMEATMVMQAPPAQEAPAVVDDAPSVMDFDLDIGGGESISAPAVEAASSPVDMDFDLDLGSSQPATEGEGNSIDFDIAASDITTPAVDGVSLSEPAAAGMDFNFDIGDAAVGDSTTPSAPPLDLSDISLDLGEPALAVDSSEVATKLELAQAYEEMGDNEGARELLQEVIAEGSTAQQEAARAKLSKLG